MSPFDDTPRRDSGSEFEHGWIYWVLGGLVVALVLIGIVTWNNGKDDRQAQDKAAQLTQKFKDSGLRTPQDQNIFIRSLGNDGGAVCENPGKSLGRAILYDQLTNGASFVGKRPVIVPRNILKGQALILEVYCPDQLKQYQDKIDKLKTDDTIKE